jgi:hypothetical protein
MKSVVNSRSGRSLQKIGKPLGPIRKLNELRTASEVKCNLEQKGKPCNALKKVNIYSKSESNQQAAVKHQKINFLGVLHDRENSVSNISDFQYFGINVLNDVY